jgi:predicted Zn finger-like uncharacterized protein
MPDQPKSDPTPRSQDAPHSPDTATPHQTGTPAAGFDLEPGARPVAEYELLQFLGGGGFGQVWKAVGPGGIQVALKFVRLDDHAGAVEQRALEVVRGIRHAHLLGCFGVWQRDGYLILALELADGSLLDRLRDAQRRGLTGLPREELLEQMREAAKGLDYLHAQHIQHRDIKPHNLLVVGDSVKVADFGLAKLLQHTRTKHTGAMTLAYAAPEFFREETSGHSDQYSLAVSYCELRGGRLPFTGSTEVITIGHVLHPPDLAMLPEAERPAVARALAKKPDERWPSCKAFVEALAAAGGAAPLTPPPPSPVVEPPRTPTEALRVACPSCGAKLKVRAESWGKRVRCSACQQSFAVPGDLPTRTSAPPAPPPPPSSATQAGPPRSRRPRPLVALVFLGAIFVVLLGYLLSAWLGRTPATGKDQASARTTQPTTTPNKPKQLANSLGMKLVLIPAGTFQMGSPLSEPNRSDDEQQHEVEITQPFYMGVYEVTQEEYERVMDTNPSNFKQVAGQNTRRFPVENVSWHDAVEFCRKLSELPAEKNAGRVYRLPTEAEWEYACRDGASDPGPFFFQKPSRSLSSDQANFNGNYPYGDAPQGRYLQRPVPVDDPSYEPNGYGLYHMHGNVWEWCKDWYGPYDPSKRQDPKGPQDGDRRVLRGGSWYYAGGPGGCRAAGRGWSEPGIRYHVGGFRVVLPARTR